MEDGRICLSNISNLNNNKNARYVRDINLRGLIQNVFLIRPK